MENRRGKNYKVSGRIWKVVEAKARKTGVAKITGRKKEKRERGEIRREGEDKKEKD